MKIKEIALKSLLPCLIIYLCLIGVSAIGYLIGIGPWRLPMDIAMIMVLAYSTLTGASGLILALFPKSREKGLTTMVVSFFMILLFLPMLYLELEMRMLGFYLAGKRAEPLIIAIEEFKKENGNIPQSIDELIPKYLSKTPYGIPDMTIHDRGNNQWSLNADAGTGLLNWDEFIFYSDQNYAEFKDSVRHLGQWVYYFE